MFLQHKLLEKPCEKSLFSCRNDYHLSSERILAEPYVCEETWDNKLKEIADRCICRCSLTGMMVLKAVFSPRPSPPPPPPPKKKKKKPTTEKKPCIPTYMYVQKNEGIYFFNKLLNW